MSANAPAASDQMVFPMSLSPIGGFFVVVSTGVVCAALTLLLTYRLPAILMALTLLTIGCCVFLLKSAIDDMSGVTVEWSGQGVSYSRLLGGAGYTWTQVEKVELHDPGATFGDWGRHEEHRVGIALFLRDPKKKDKEPVYGAPPDVIVVTRCGEAADKIPKLLERLTAAKRQSSGKDGVRKIGAAPAAAAPKGGKPGKSGKSGKSFRRTAA